MKTFDEKAQEVISISNSILSFLDIHTLDKKVAYAAIAYAFSQLHFEMGKTIQDWENTTMDMTEHFNRQGKK